MYGLGVLYCFSFLKYITSENLRKCQFCEILLVEAKKEQSAT